MFYPDTSETNFPYEEKGGHLMLPVLFWGLPFSGSRWHMQSRQWSPEGGDIRPFSCWLMCLRILPPFAHFQCIGFKEGAFHMPHCCLCWARGPVAPNYDHSIGQPRNGQWSHLVLLMIFSSRRLPSLFGLCVLLCVWFRNRQQRHSLIKFTVGISHQWPGFSWSLSDLYYMKLTFALKDFCNCAF